MGKTEKQIIAIVCGGKIQSYNWLKKNLMRSNFIIAADSGYDKCLKCEIKPDLIIGDFDSVESTVDDLIPKITFPARKDKTDFMLCLDYCKEQNYKDISVFGAWGGRADHSLGAVFALLEASKNRIYPKILTEKSEMFIVDKTCIIPKNKGYVSVFALEKAAKGVTLQGFDFPLKNAKLECCSQLGVSNKIIDEYGKIEVKNGKLLIVIQN